MQHSHLQQPTVKLRRIKLGRNPRKYFDDAEMEEMKATVRVSGVHTAVIVRPLDEEYFELIAGGRRYRAAMETRGEDYDMPVTVVVDRRPDQHDQRGRSQPRLPLGHAGSLADAAGQIPEGSTRDLAR